MYRGGMDFVAGCFGGASGTLVSHPFDTVKVRIQAQTPCNMRYRGTLHCFAEIIRKESVYGLYKGLLAPLYGTIALNAIIFGVHGNVKRISTLKNPLHREYLAGAAAGFAESLVACPMELIKTRMQLQAEGVSRSTTLQQCYRGQPYAYASPMDCLRKIYTHENKFRGVYRGLVITLCRNIPSFSIYFGSYFYFCTLLNATGENSVNVLKTFLAGGSAGVVCWVLVYPMDVVKTRLQLDGMGRTLYKGAGHCARSIYAAEGAGGFFKGLTAQVMRSFPNNGATLTTTTLFLSYVL